jgi:hypothetical protein
MSSIKTIFYFISGIYLLISILFAIFDRTLYDRFGEDYFILFIPYWLGLSCGIIIIGWSAQIYQEKMSRKKIRQLEKDNDKLKAKMYDLIQNQEYAQSAQIVSKQTPTGPVKPSKEQTEQKPDQNFNSNKEQENKPNSDTR